MSVKSGWLLAFCIFLISCLFSLLLKKRVQICSSMDLAFIHWVLSSAYHPLESLRKRGPADKSDLWPYLREVVLIDGKASPLWTAPSLGCISWNEDRRYSRWRKSKNLQATASCPEEILRKHFHRKWDGRGTFETIVGRKEEQLMP